MSASDKLEDALIDRDVRLLRVEAGIKRAASRRLKELEAEIVEDIINGDPTSMVYAGGKERRAQSVLTRATARIAKAFGLSRGEFKAAALQVVPMEAVNLREEVNDAVGAQLMNRDIPAKAARELVDDLTIEGAKLNNRWKRQAATVSNGVSDAVMAAVRRGDNLGQLVAAVRGTASVRFQDGLFRGYDRQTAALIQTAFSNTINAARHDVYKRHVELIEALQAINPLDSKTSTICQARAGRVWTPDGRPGTGTREPFPGHPPWHFQCRTTLIPILKPFDRLQRTRGLTAQQRGQLKQMSKDQQVGLNGKPAAGQTYEAFLRKQTAETRRELLGEQKAKLFADGKIGMTDLIDQSGRPMTVEALKEKAGVD